MELGEHQMYLEELWLGQWDDNLRHWGYCRGYDWSEWSSVMQGPAYQA